MWKFLSKPRAPGPMKIGAAIGCSQGLSKEERPMSRQDVVEDMISKLDLPSPFKAQLRELHRIEEE